MKEIYNWEKHLDRPGVKDLFTIPGGGGLDSPHSVYDAELSFEKEHHFQSYEKEKNIDQYGSEEGEAFFRITRKKENQFITSQLLGGVIQVSPIYIDEEGRYFSKMVEYPENLMEGAAGLFILNVIANDWDHELPYHSEIEEKNYTKGSFFDFSHSEIAIASVQSHEDKKSVAQRVGNWLNESSKRLQDFAEENSIKVSREQIRSELKEVILRKLQTLLVTISIDAVKAIYEKIDYYHTYQQELLEPERLYEHLVMKIQAAIDSLN